MTDTIRVRLEQRMGVESTLNIKKGSKEGSLLRLEFARTLSDWPWKTEDQNWFKEEWNRELEARGYNIKVSSIWCNSIPLSQLATPARGNNGRPDAEYKYRKTDTRIQNGSRLVRKEGERIWNKGLNDRYIALWQSHGRYYHCDSGEWRWQRVRIHRSVEDLLTQGFVIPYLMPMLENAGAFVMTPRERDYQTAEYIIDNDPSFERDANDSLCRRQGNFSISGNWSSIEKGFADTKRYYQLSDTPFSNGTALQCKCSYIHKSEAKWTPDIQERGRYAVYVSYKSFSNSCTAAQYSVKHLGGTSRFSINQRRGGDTWIYLGTFEFGKGNDSYVSLSNVGENGCVVCADAVKIGGGYGKISREGTTSGHPAFVEGALYSMPWFGADSSCFKEWEADYTRDFAGRGAWTKEMKEKHGIPFDLSLALHTDAGKAEADSTIGTLVIYTLKEDGKRTFDDNSDRMVSRTLAEWVQDQVVSDLREDFDQNWNRRQIWDRSYSESRTTGVPAMLLELLSHQNFNDMKYALDPNFRFEASRAIYKGILKFLSERYGCSYEVQPLPVHSAALRFDSDSTVCLSWKATEDTKEPTAVSKGYRIYTRVDDGAFDLGKDVKETSCILPIKAGHIFSYKIAAWNDGGLSFPSEILSVGVPEGAPIDELSGLPRKDISVLIVNNFTRVSAPDWVDTPQWGGFLGRKDAGIPYIEDYSYVGETWEYDKAAEYESDLNPGHGACWDDYAGRRFAGNSFDYPYMHGCSLLKLGRAFISCSSEAFNCETDFCGQAGTLDLICGKQKTTITGTGKVEAKYTVFPYSLRQAMRKWGDKGGNMIVSGAYIASDGNDMFLAEVLGIKSLTRNASFSNLIGGMPFYNCINSISYGVEEPDGIGPADKFKARTILRYDATGVAAAVRFNGGNYKAVSIGVPIETICKESDRTATLGLALEKLQ